jgi:Zn-dependent M28 family amino/carboxypeptidase
VNRLHPRARWTSGAALLGAAALVATTVSTTPALAEDGTERRSVRAVMDHLERFEAIGNKHDGRASGTPGYRASRNYVVRQLERSGYSPQVQAFDFPFFQQLAPTVFERTAPTEQTYTENTDYYLMEYSGAGTADAPVEAVDLALAEPASSTSGCEASDFEGFTAGNIALVQRGTCAFGDKVANADAAGASGVIVFNQGNGEGRTDAFPGTLGGPVADIPSVATSFAIGEALAAPGTEARLEASTESAIRKTWNVTAETAGDRQNVVMAGAHLDSVVGGNGVNDNGSGSAALLETAKAMAATKGKPTNRVRFAWWGAEENGLLGSEHWVADMAENHPRKFQNIALYLNFDMVGSPNYILGVYDGNNNAFPPEESADAPQGSAAIERMYTRFFDKLGTGSVPTAFSGRSDYGPFIALNVPAGGLFTGAEGVKTAEEAAMFGGTAGEAYDSCYHQECDTIGNVNRQALRANTAAIMHSVAKYAKSTRSVNGSMTGHQPPVEDGPAARRSVTRAQHGPEHGRDYHPAHPAR